MVTTAITQNLAASEAAVASDRSMQMFLWSMTHKLVVAASKFPSHLLAKPHVRVPVFNIPFTFANIDLNFKSSCSSVVSRLWCSEIISTYINREESVIAGLSSFKSSTTVT